VRGALSESNSMNQPLTPQAGRGRASAMDWRFSAGHYKF
jgi:hypothetical protein